MTLLDGSGRIKQAGKIYQIVLYLPAIVLKTPNNRDRIANCLLKYADSSLSSAID
jgi:hypothetical protein